MKGNGIKNKKVSDNELKVKSRAGRDPFNWTEGTMFSKIDSVDAAVAVLLGDLSKTLLLL